MRKHVVHSFAKAAYFVLHFIGPHRPVGHSREIQAHDQRRPPGNAGRHTDSSELPRRAHCSPNPPATSSASARAACSASGPFARMVIELPHSAASIITPIM